MGQISFSMIATVLLLSTVAAGVYLAKREVDRFEAERRERLMAEMAASVDEVVLEVTLAATARAHAVVSGWDAYPVNHSALSEEFSRSMLEYLASGFPRDQSGFTMRVGNWTGGLFFSEMKTVDLVSSDDTAREELVMDGSAAVIEGVPAGCDEVVGERTACPYYVATGSLTVNVSSGTTAFERDASFERPVVSALPFLESKVRAFESASFGEMSDLGKLVEYMLTTLAQLRVLEGYGTPVYSGGLATADFIAKALFEALREALEETRTAEVTASLEFLQTLGRRVLDNFIDNLLDIIKEVVHEVVFYLEATLSDATGAAGAGLRLSFIVGGEAVSELLKWLIKSLATYIVNLGRAGNPVEYPPSPEAFFADLHIRFEVLFFVGMPRLLSALGGRVDQSLRVTALVAISPNMPAIGRLVGRDWGRWEVDFGLCLEGIPREVVGSLFVGASGERVDVWLVRARAYGA
ncbi:MAG: hypothetical protein JSV90_03480 [Methanobacteriota archaeon]|nr:MAG: hypothetical protein JSV90_03480 [Euryarchaeota archaeon]